MRVVRIVLVIALLAVPPPLPPRAEAASDNSLTSLSALDAKARLRTAAKPRVVLPEDSAESLKDLDTQEWLENGRVPNYLRALSATPGAANAYAHLIKTVLYGGTLEPEVKQGMGFRIAQVYGSPYVAAHMRRLLQSTERGRTILANLRAENFDTLSPADRLALNYSEWLTRDVHGVSDADFQKVRGYFNDSQVVELTLTVCFFNYFTRLAEGLNLPLESWVLDSAAKPLAAPSDPPVARVALISDAEMKATSDMDAALKDPKGPASSWRIGFANSMRAMLRCPEVAKAWMNYGTTVRQSAAIDREIQLQVSFAVSMANGCRYCTLHQVLGLRRIGVSMTKLMEMKKDDDALTPREKVAVLFARKLTEDPVSLADTDYQGLRAEFGDRGALDVLLQTSAFSFMNRFTDGLRLPSEDEAIRVYREVYGTAPAD
jgi:AhpD family alkylhydroperoxidase